MSIRVSGSGGGGSTGVDRLASDNGWLSWNFDLATFAGSAIPTAGTLYLNRLKIPQPTTITNLALYVITAGATLTANQNFFGLYDVSTRALLGQTADQATNWASSGLKEVALTSTVSVTSDVYVGFYWNGTTGPNLARGCVSPVTLGIDHGTLFWGTSNTGLTTTPPSTATNPGNQGSSFWVAVS